MVLLLNSILAYAIPDLPNNLALQKLREKQLQKEIEFYDEMEDGGGDDDGLDAGFDGISMEGGGTPDDAESGVSLGPNSGGFKRVGRKKSMTLGQALRMRTGTAGGRGGGGGGGRRSSMVGPMALD